jgi:hypothetical protein
MPSTGTRSVLFATALPVAALALQTETADAAAKRGRTTSAQRDTMIEQCIAKAQAETPFYIPGQSGYRRADIYKNCMFQAGMRP